MPRREATDVKASRWKTAAPWGILVVGLLAWLWPIGLGGQMPVGGDVTQFSIGLMAVLGRALREGRIPFWNDLWGYGFPGLAESQMGVFYPPHVVLYGLLPVEWAYTASLVLHTLWAGLGAAWAARRFGTSARGAAVAGFAWASCGFFLIHLPHQWGATTASWMPWAWGLAWSISRGEGGRRSAILLACVLALQVLPGHFQLAFITLVTTALIGLCGLLTPGDRRWRLVRLGLALAGVVPLGLAQLGPTAELAGLAGSQRSVEYLSVFATPPTHLVSYVAPGLFQMSPLWRPLAWDAFRAMPEEHRAAIGLVPLFLAVIALKKWRDPAVRTLVVVALAATYLSLGPYLPGFVTYSRLPGFSFFRAPARWGAAAMLALSILSGRGLDGLPTLLKPGRGLRRFVLIAACLPALVVGAIELALFANEPIAGRPTHPELAMLLEGSFRLLMPWPYDEARRMAEGMPWKPLDDPRVKIALARQGRPFGLPADRTLTLARGSIYAQELGPTLFFLAALFIVSFLDDKRRMFEVVLLVIVMVEAGYWSRQRPFDLGPARPLTEQSAVLNQLASLPRGTRSVDPSQNLSMVAGVAPLSAYRTLDLPVMTELTRSAISPLYSRRPPYGYADSNDASKRAAGVGVQVVPGKVYGPHGKPPLVPGWELLAEVSDPTLVGWLTGADWVRSPGNRVVQDFQIWRPTVEPARACFTRINLADLPTTGDPDEVLPALSSVASAQPLTWRSSRPEDISIDFDASGPGTVVLAQLDYPRWRATLNGEPVPIARVFDGWQGVQVFDPGQMTLRLTYDTTRDWVCIAVSGVAWMGWGLLYWRARPRVGDQVEEDG